MNDISSYWSALFHPQDVCCFDWEGKDAKEEGFELFQAIISTFGEENEEDHETAIQSA